MRGLALGWDEIAGADTWAAIARMVWWGARDAWSGGLALGWDGIAGADTWAAIVRMVWWEAGVCCITINR